jgi:RNA polymerase sigma-70 factor (ECF subfamily)
MALICFTASRNEARLDVEGNILLLKEQNRSRWNQVLIEKGISHLEASAPGEHVNRYQLEAGIAYEHARAAKYALTNWDNILQCYDLMCQFYSSPIVELNRAIVISELHGPAKGIKTIEAITQLSTLKKYYLLPATLGELHLQLKQYEKADRYFAEAMQLTQSAAEKKLLQQKMKR